MGHIIIQIKSLETNNKARLVENVWKEIARLIIRTFDKLTDIDHFHY